jgi:Meiotically up-regulated gene 113
MTSAACQPSLFPGATPATGHIWVGVRGRQIKIGYTSCSPQQRAIELGLVLLHCERGDRDRERELHRRIRGARIDREWFPPSPQVLTWIASHGA